MESQLDRVVSYHYALSVVCGYIKIKNILSFISMCKYAGMFLATCIALDEKITNL